MADARGLFQRPSGDEAADSLTGFSLGRARLGIRLAQPDWHLSLHAQAKLDHDFALLDADVGWIPRPWFGLHIGQFKIPGTYEALTEDRDLDFILRADITTALADYALSKAQHPVSLLYGSASNLRDLGIAAKGEIKRGWIGGRYFLMVGNGLGANMYFGGETRKEYFITNEAQFFYGGRAELLAAGVVTLGGFATYNRHDNIVFNSGRAVYDIHRRSIGGDLRVMVPHSGLRLAALGGGGEIRDDFNGDGRIDLRYSGWAASAVWNVFPAVTRITGSQLPERHGVELAFRFDRLDTEVDESDENVRRDHYTLGASYLAADRVKVQLNYIIRQTKNPSLPELTNNILFANFQAAF